MQVFSAQNNCSQNTTTDEDNSTQNPAADQSQQKTLNVKFSDDTVKVMDSMEEVMY